MRQRHEFSTREHWAHRSRQLNELTHGIPGWLRRRGPRVWLPGAGILLLVLLGWNGMAGKRSHAASPTSGQSEAIAVDAVPAKRTDVPVYLQGLGTVQAFNTVTVTARVDGELQKIGFV